MLQLVVRLVADLSPGFWRPLACGSRFLAAAWLIGGTMSAAASGAGAAPAASAIQAITLERGCFGCADAGLLELRRDGAATLTVAGNARRGIEGSTRQGRLAPGEFDRLAALLVARGFFRLDETYQDPDVRDGNWLTLGVAGALPAKRVFSRLDAGPPALQAMVAAVEAAKSRIRFTP